MKKVTNPECYVPKRFARLPSPQYSNSSCAVSGQFRSHTWISRRRYASRMVGKGCGLRRKSRTGGRVGLPATSPSQRSNTCTRVTLGLSVNLQHPVGDGETKRQTHLVCGGGEGDPAEAGGRVAAEVPQPGPELLPRDADDDSPPVLRPYLLS